MHVLESVSLSQLGKKQQGKVRDYYIVGDKRILITTDRVSAFDRVLGLIPYKGQVLNRLAAFWFEKTKDIIPNHMLTVPDPNVMVVTNCELIPLEIVVRGYISGVTDTALWTQYAKGERMIYGIDFPDGLKKNQKLITPVITPTTKAESGHDERITKKEILERKIVSEKLYSEIEQKALELFTRGSTICAKAGMILVDTKYEFGLLHNKLVLIDEIHTPDSSRFWVRDTYQERFKKGLEPENFDKEFLRLWFVKKRYTGDGAIPTMPDSFIKKVSKRYIEIFKRLTQEKIIKNHKETIEKRIQKNLKNYGTSN